MPHSCTPRALEWTERLVSIDTSRAASIKPVFDIIRDALPRLAAVRLVSLPDVTGTKENMIITIGDPTIPGIVLSGHIDVVPAADKGWSSPPFQPARRNDRLYGRGTSDMKSFIGCALSMMDMLLQRDLPYPVYLAITCDEETAMLEADRIVTYLLQHGAKPALAIIGEPTNMQICTHHRGGVDIFISFGGLAAHASQPERGINAVCMANDFMTELRKLSFQGSAPGWRSLVNIGPISGGHTGNIIPDHCSLSLDCRVTEMTHVDDIIDHIEMITPDIISRYSIAEHMASIRVQALPLIPPLQKGNSVLAQKVIHSKVHDLHPIQLDQQFSGATEAGFYDRAGIPSIVMGPGSLQQAHTLDEYIDVAQVDLCCQVLDALLVADLLEGKQEIT